MSYSKFKAIDQNCSQGRCSLEPLHKKTGQCYEMCIGFVKYKHGLLKSKYYPVLATIYYHEMFCSLELEKQIGRHSSCDYTERYEHMSNPSNIFRWGELLKLFVQYKELNNHGHYAQLNATVRHNYKTLVNLTLNNKHSILTKREKFKLFFDLHNPKMPILEFINKYEPLCWKQIREPKKSTGEIINDKLKDGGGIYKY